MKSTSFERIAPSISIIIPVCGRLGYVMEAINSIYRQSNINRSDYEIIIIEDSNPKETIISEIKKTFPELIVVINYNEHSPAGSRNTGLSHARGKYIVFLDSDDQLKPEFLYEMSSMIKGDNNCSAAVCFSISIFEEPYRILRKIKLYLLMIIRDISILISYFFHNKYLFPSAFYLCQISHMVFKAEKIRNLKFNYIYSRGGEDWDFFNRCLDRGPIRIIPKRLITFRYSLASSTNLTVNLKQKWQSYKILASKLSPERKKGVFYKLFLYYIDLFK